MPVDRYQNTTGYDHPQESNLLNTHKAMQYRPDTGEPEVRVNIGSAFTISGTVNIPGTVNVASSSTDPVHVHLTEIGTSGILNVPYMPIYGTVTATQGTTPWVVTGTVGINNFPTSFIVSNFTNTVNVATLPAITGTVTIANTSFNITNFPTSFIVSNFTNTVNVATLPAITGTVTIANTSFNITNFPTTSTVYQGTTPWTVTGNVTVTNFTSTVNINSMPPVTVSNFTSTVMVSNTVTVAQGTTPWVVTGTVSIGSISEVEIKNDIGYPVPVSANTATNSVDNPIYTSVAAGGVTAFGEPLAIQPVPVIQLDPIFGVDDVTIYQTYSSGGGIVTTTNSMYVVGCSTSSYSYGVLRSRRFLRYHPGQGAVGRFACMFDTAKDNTTQQAGMFNQENGFMIGYNGTKFGILHRRGYKAAIYLITLTSYTGAQTVTITLGGVVTIVSLLGGETIYQAASRISDAIGGAWLAEDKDNTVELLHTGTGAVGGTFSITSSGNLVASITQIRAGDTGAETWYYSNPGIGDNAINGTLLVGFNPQTFNVYQIDYRWLGAGRIQFLYEDPVTAIFKVMHTIHWVNQHTTPHVDNPSMKIGFVAYNLGGSNAVTLTGCSMYMANQGLLGRNEYTRSTSNTKTGLSKDLLHHVITIRNPYTWRGKINTRELIMQDLTVACQSTDPLEMHFYLDAPLLTGLHDFQSQPTGPVTISKVDGTLDVTALNPIVSYTIGINGNQQFDLSNYRIVVPPGATVTIAITSTNGVTRASAGMVWYVD